MTPMFATPSTAIPSLPTLQLSDDEAQAASWLATRLFDKRPYLEKHNLYYDGLQKMQDLGISIPPALSNLRTVIGWPRVGVDALSNRCRIDGFRFPGSSSADEDLWDIWQANNLDAESMLAQIDSLVYSRSYLVVGPSDTGDQPLITAESPINMTAIYDARMRVCTSALQVYLDTDYTSDMFGQEVAALYLPGKTVVMSRQGSIAGPLANGKWNIVQRDDHGLDRIPVVVMANRCRLSNRDGLSEITPEWMNTVDSANRTLLGMEVGREFFAAPRRYALGVSEESFQKPDGTSATAWDAYMSKVWMLERDEEGNVPTVGQFPASDPSAFTKILDTYAKVMSGEMGVPPHFLGVYSDGNPASADAIRSGYEELVSRARNKHVQFGDAWEEAMRLALIIRDGSAPTGANRIETDWVDPSPKTPLATSHAIYEEVIAGILPATSTVTLGRLGYSPAEITRIEMDRKRDGGSSILDEVGRSILAKMAKVDTTIATDVAPELKGTTVVQPGVAAITIPKKSPVQPPHG
jgi:hypothetical protein